MKKLKLYIDVDNCLVHSVRRMCDIYTKYYSSHPNYIKPNPDKIMKWDAEDELPLLTKEDIKNLFEEDEFYTGEIIKDDAIKVLYELHSSNKFDFCFVSIGTSKNIANKTQFLENYLPFIQQHIMLVKNFVSDLRMDKSILTGKGVLLDDHVNNLITTNVDFPVLFKDQGNREWNEGWKGSEVSSWLEFRDLAFRMWELYCKDE